MDTREFVTYVKRIAPAWSRLDILEFTRIAQDTVFSVPLEQMRYRVEGKDPILSTQAGQHRYELSQTNFGQDIAFISNVYPTDYYSDSYGRTMADKVQATTLKASGKRNAIVTFTNDPGDSKFFVSCYRRPKNLLSELSELEINSDLLIPNLLKGVVGLIETAEHGNSNAYAEFLKEYMPELRYHTNEEGHNTVYLPVGRGY